jgi:uncharacterized membrane protein YkvA (DUF1232 family)
MGRPCHPTFRKNPFPPPEQPEPDTGKTIFPLRAAHPILAAVLPLRRPPVPALPGAAPPHVPGRTSVLKLLFPPERGKRFNLHIHILIMNLQKQQLLLRLFRYFKSKKGEPRFFNRRNIWLLAIAAAYILTPDEFLFDGIGKLGLLDDAAVILGAVFTVFFPDGD